jgi:hypothetical protein
MMMLTSEIDMANSVEPADIDTFINSLTSKPFWREQNLYFLVGKYSIST